MASPIVKTLLSIAIFSYCAFMAIGLPLVLSISDAVNEFNTSLETFKSKLQNGKVVYGSVSESNNKDCVTFNCPHDEVALPGPLIDRHMPAGQETMFCVCVPSQEVPMMDLIFKKIRHEKRDRRSETIEPLTKDTNFTYVPPAKTDITPDLLAQSLAIQPQDTATVSSIMPHFQDSVISYGIQLNGLVAATMTLNASVSLPCAAIGAEGQAQPDLVLRPKDIDNGTVQAYIPDCTIVAVNMYNPNLINYWVMNDNGSIFSLIGSNKLMDIDQLNSTASTSLVLRAKPAGTVRRDRMATIIHEGMVEVAKRALSRPDTHTTSMTPEACAAMKCNNNGNRPAVFNPFTKTCWCKDPVYVETGTV